MKTWIRRTVAVTVVLAVGVALATVAGLQLAERKAQRRIAAHSFGHLTGVTGVYHQDWLLEPDDDNWRVDSALGGASRAFADIGSHWCDLAEFVTGHRITRLSATTASHSPVRSSNSRTGSPIFRRMTWSK